MWLSRPSEESTACPIWSWAQNRCHILDRWEVSLASTQKGFPWDSLKVVIWGHWIEKCFCSLDSARKRWLSHTCLWINRIWNSGCLPRWGSQVCFQNFPQHHVHHSSWTLVIRLQRRRNQEFQQWVSLSNSSHHSFWRRKDTACSLCMVSVWYFYFWKSGA